MPYALPPKLILVVSILGLLTGGSLFMIDAYQRAHPPAMTTSWEQTYQVQSVHNLTAPFLFTRVKVIHTTDGKDEPVIYDSLKITVDPKVDCFPQITIRHALFQGDTNVINLSGTIKFRSCEQMLAFLN